MDYQIIELEEFNVIGIRYELSKSLSNNVKLAQNHWKIFNSKLRNNKLYFQKVLILKKDSPTQVNNMLIKQVSS